MVRSFETKTLGGDWYPARRPATSAGSTASPPPARSDAWAPIPVYGSKNPSPPTAGTPVFGDLNPSPPGPSTPQYGDLNPNPPGASTPRYGDPNPSPPGR